MTKYIYNPSLGIYADGIPARDVDESELTPAELEIMGTLVQKGIYTIDGQEKKADVRQSTIIADTASNGESSPETPGS